MPVLPYPKLHDQAPFVVLSDWVNILTFKIGRHPATDQLTRQDGTITTKDSNDFLTDNLGTLTS
jgi:hypothetical protein